MGYGGAERLIVDMLASRDRQGFDYEFAYILTAENALVPSIEATGVPVHNLGARNNFDFRWMARFRELLRRGRFDVVHFHLPYTAGMGRLVAASLPPKERPALMYTEHSLWFKAPKPLRALNRSTIGLDDALVVVSPAAHDALPGPLRARAEVVVHGVDLSYSDALVARREEIRHQVRDELEIPDEDLLVMTVANLRVEKGYDVLLDATRIVADRGLPMRFAAVGRGPLQAELDDRLHALRLGVRFRFLGQRDDALKLLTAADIFVLASHQEGLPVALMEATSVGIPIVATRVGGVPGVITDGVDGLLVPPGDPDAVAGALQRLQGDPHLRHSLGKGAKALSANFDVSTASRRIEGIYRRVSPTPR
jgi:glycosyltransferase involved in cell wall biosynthesis